MNHFILMLMFINSVMFMQSNHPMSMGIILLIQTLLTCIFTSFMTKNFWFSYILFLIFIGGMLILFIYMASLASNEKFYFSMLMFIVTLLLFMIFNFYMFMDIFYTNSNFTGAEMTSFKNFLILMKTNNIPISKMFDYPNNWITIFLINYLLLNLIVIVKITNIFNGPLRKKN